MTTHPRPVAGPRLRTYGLTLLLMLGLGLYAAATTRAMADSSDPAVQEKLIHIRPAGGGDNTLNVSIKPGKSTYHVNETIRFKVQGDKTFYLYLFNVDPSTKRGLSILPNRYQGTSAIKYSPGIWHTVPNANLEFYADRTGTERIIMVASIKYLDVAKLLKRAGSKSVGDFFALDTPLDALDETLSDSYSEKRIRIRESGSRLPPGVAVQEMNLHIVR